MKREALPTFVTGALAYKRFMNGVEFDEYFDCKVRRGANGEKLCRWCHEEITDTRRRSFCSQDCADDYEHELRVRLSGNHVRWALWRRDKGICAHCGTASDKYCDEKGTGWHAHHKVAVEDGGGCCGLENYITLCDKCHKVVHGGKAQADRERIKEAKEAQITIF